MFSVPLDLIPAASFSASGVGAPGYVGRNRSLALVLDVYAVTPSPMTPPTLDVTIETAASPDAPTWRVLGAFAQATAAGSYALTLTGADAFARARYALSKATTFDLALGGAATLIVLASATLAASGVGPVVDVGQYRAARLTLDVTAATGATPTLDVTIETAENAGATTWRTCATFPTLAGVGAIDLTASDFDRYIRVRHVLASGATFAASVAGVSVFVFARPMDRARMGIRAAAIPNVMAADAAEAVIGVSAVMLGSYQRYRLPLRAWDEDSRKCCAVMADWWLISERGYEPGKQTSADGYRVNYLEWNNASKMDPGWLQQVARRDVAPTGIVDSSQPSATGTISRVAVVSSPLRGWGKPLPPGLP